MKELECSTVAALTTSFHLAAVGSVARRGARGKCYCPWNGLVFGWNSVWAILLASVSVPVFLCQVYNLFP